MLNQSPCFIEFKNVILKIITEFHSRFKYFDKLKPKLELFNNPGKALILRPFDFASRLFSSDTVNDNTGQCKMGRMTLLPSRPPKVYTILSI